MFSRDAIGGPADGAPVIVVLNLDPHHTRETMVHLDLAALGVDGDSFVVRDELNGQTWQWGAHNYVRLDPQQAVAHILTVVQV